MTSHLLNSQPQGSVKVIKDYSYALNDCIGKGFSSNVYSGKYDPTGESLAIKVINMKMLKNKSHKQLLASQLYCLKKLKGCPGIIQMKDVFETANNTYIITELCKGGDLDKHLNGKKFSEAKAIQYMQQIIQGYLELFKHHIIHRDLKPANIFINQGQLKIADLGFAVKESQKNNSSINVGSPLYMPPEALKYNEYSFKSDIWALGVIFYQMLFGRTPWRASTQKQLPKKMMSIPISKVIPPGSIGLKSLEFLMRTLNTQIKFRMSPEELIGFNFFSENTNQQLSSQIIQNSKIMQSSQYGNRRSVDSVIERRFATHMTKFKKQRFDTHMDTPTNMTTYYSTKQKAVLTPKTQTSQRGAKQLTSQFLSQIHLCRFIYKIINSLNEVMRDCQPLRQHLTKYIYHKLYSILEMQNNNPYALQNLDQFKDSAQYKKIISVSRKYLIKYQKQLGFVGKQTPQKLLRHICDSLSLTNLSSQSIELYQQHIILVDYLMTTYLLIKLEARSDLKTFHEKSKIQDIVEGSTHKVTDAHYDAIKMKIKQLGFA